MTLFTTDENHVGIPVREMAERIKRTYPCIRFVVISAYGGRTPELVKEELVDELMYKPFDADEYRRLVGKYIGLLNV